MQVEGVLFEDVTVSIEGCSYVGVSNLALDVKDILTRALRDGDCCVYQIVKAESWYTKVRESRFIGSF